MRTNLNGERRFDRNGYAKTKTAATAMEENKPKRRLSVYIY